MRRTQQAKHASRKAGLRIAQCRDSTRKKFRQIRGATEGETRETTFEARVSVLSVDPGVPGVPGDYFVPGCPDFMPIFCRSCAFAIPAMPRTFDHIQCCPVNFVISARAWVMS